jgi:prepilin-type N-terminal cleavage/methylation domain-containing protein
MARRTARRRAQRRGQRGLTLIELMIALLISSLLIGMVFAVYTRMSVAYRQQSIVSELQQTLVAAKAMLQKELHQAGYLLPNGYQTLISGGPVPYPPQPALSVINNADGSGPDLIRWYYADGRAKARVEDFPALRQSLTVDTAEEFAEGDIAVIVSTLEPANSPLDPLGNLSSIAKIAQTTACVVQITGITGNQMDLGPNLPYNMVGNPHCTETQARAAVTDVSTMVYRFVARGLRIDPARKDLSVLQLNTDLANPNTWSDLAVGFTDLQVASRYFEGADGTDRDGDGDPLRDWYSGESQEVGDASGDRPTSTVAGATPFAVSVSLAVRTWEQVNLVPSSRTPAFIGADANHNRFGNSESFDLEGTADALRPLEHKGRHVYRWMSTLIDLRNLGVGVRGAL